MMATQIAPMADAPVNLDEVKGKQAALGKVSPAEVKTIIWIAIAVTLWLTEGITGLNIGFG